MRVLIQWGVAAVMFMVLPGLAPSAMAAEPPVARISESIQVYKTPTCGCCGKWVDHMRAHGFTLDVTDMDDVSPVKTRNGISPQLSSCHTSLVGGYVIEGHVPAEDVRRLLKERPAILGLTAPGMPQGSPGMDIPNSGPYEVLAIGKDGTTSVYARHD